jgi:hypothetical protein
MRDTLREGHVLRVQIAHPEIAAVPRARCEGEMRTTNRCESSLISMCAIAQKTA